MPNHSEKMELFWELSYAQYLTIPRSVIQEMSIEWQDKLAKLLNELDDKIDWRPPEGRYWVVLETDDEFEKLDIGLSDPLAEYRGGNQYAIDLIKRT